MTASARRRRLERSARISISTQRVGFRTGITFWFAFLLVLRLLLLYSTIIIDKYEWGLVVGIYIALGAFVSRAKVALEDLSGAIL